MNTFRRDLQLFCITDYAKIIKVLIGVFCSFIVANILRFSSVSVSASTVLVILMSSNESNSRSYLKRRMLSQLIGVPVAVVFYYVISACPGIPPLLHSAITVTVAVGAALVINQYFHIVSQWSSLVMAVFIVISFESQNPGYPLLRIEQVLLGILLGYLIHRFVFPINVFILANKQFEEVSNEFFEFMEEIIRWFESGLTNEVKFSDLREDVFELEKSLVAVQADLTLKSFNRYDKHSNKLKSLKTCSSSIQHTIEIFELLQTSTKSYKELRGEFKECFTISLYALLNLHRSICKQIIEEEFSELKVVVIPTISLENREEVILMGHIYEYERDLAKLVSISR